MKIELKTSFLFGLLIGLLLVLLFGKPRKTAQPTAEKPSAKPESARPQNPPESWRNRPGARTTKTEIDVEAQKPTGDSEFDKETARLDAEAFGSFNDFMSARRAQKVGQSS